VQRYAVFDLDHTITSKGTWGRFVSQSVKKKPWKFLGLWLRAGVGQLRYRIGRDERISVKLAMLRWTLAGQSRETLAALAESFAENEIKHGLRPGAVRQIDAHQSAGDIVIIASAGADLVVEAIARRLKIHTVISTNLAWEGGKCAGYFGSDNCYGQGKLDALQKCLETFDDFQRESAHIIVYSDSHSDLPAMNFADKAVAVNADKKLLGLAKVNGFEIVDWSV